MSPSSLRLAVALARIPHLGRSLFLFPLILSLGIVISQLLLTGLLVRMTTISSSVQAKNVEIQTDHSPVRWLLYGSNARRPELRVCRWGDNKDSSGEAPPAGCNPDRLDVAIQVSDPKNFDASTYQRIFNGHIDRLHICKTCRPDVTIKPEGVGLTKSTAHSVFGLAILSLPYTNHDIGSRRVELLRVVEDIRSILGEISMSIPEISNTIGISALKSTLPITLNVALLVMTALWLALRAHRKVLDYLSRNDVLLPLAAACGKERFYSAIWILTIFRVGAFLAASIPIMYYGLSDILTTYVDSPTNITPLDFIIWLFALSSTLAVSTIIASISELQHRHALLSVCYRFVPIVIALTGAVAWSFSFILPYQSAGILRLIMSAIPVLGIAPILAAPVTNLPYFPMLLHGVLALLTMILLLRRNARWFAAHLEEV